MYRKHPAKYINREKKKYTSLLMEMEGATRAHRMAMDWVATMVISHAPLMPFSIPGLSPFTVMIVKNVYIIMTQPATPKVRKIFAKYMLS